MAVVGVLPIGSGLALPLETRFPPWDASISGCARCVCAMHMPRAVGVFRNSGFEVDAYPVEYLTTGAKEPWTLPRALMSGIGITDLPGARMDWHVGLLDYRTNIGAVSRANF